MPKTTRSVCAFLAVLLLTPLAGAQEQERIPLSSFGRASVRIETHSGKAHKFDVYLARSPQEMMQGLMYVEELPADGGMLFSFDPPRPASMWMKNTLIPLDLVFIKADGTIANIVANAAPETLEPRRAEGVVTLVLELNGGTAKRLSIGAGDRVLVEPNKD